MAAFLLLLLGAIAVRNSVAEKITLEFILNENTGAPTYVGSVATDSGIIEDVSQEEFRTLRYNFLNPNDLRTSSYFTINKETGAIYTAAMIDRESPAVCSYSFDCTITFDVTVRSSRTSYFEIVTVKVTVIDSNDNAPRFPKSTVTLNVPESVPLGKTYRLDRAIDPDKDNNSVSSYEMISDTRAFGLIVDHSLDGSLSIKLKVNEHLDREKQDQYKLIIIAKDGGSKPLSGNVTVIVNVTDVNDNSPVFTENVYDFNVTEDRPVGAVFGFIRARDRDSGRNGEIRYRFSPHRSSKILQLFHLNSKTGQLSVKKPLEYESGNNFETVVEASDNGEMEQKLSQAILIIRILDVGNNAPKIIMNPVSSDMQGTVILSEGARVGTVVAHIKVEDNDEGQNGLVNCRSRNRYFMVQVMEGRGYNVQLKRRLDREKQTKHNLTVVCEDNGRPRMATTSQLIVEVTDVNDNPPIFTRKTYYANITENNRLGAVVTKVTATDRDTGKNALMLYFMNLDGDSMFRIDHQTGDITANVVFDRETLSQMTFTVKAVDEGETSMSGTATVVVTVLDQNDNQPYLDPSNLVFNVSEGQPPGTKVGQLTSKDRDIGVNAETDYLMLVRGDLPPFAVFQDGVIRTDRKIDRSYKDKYEFDVMVKDGGQPPLNRTGRVYINIVDSNVYSPIILFPNNKNHTVQITSDTEPGTVITEISAYDDDEGINGKLSYHITDGNKDGPFDIISRNGRVVLARRIRPSDQEAYRLSIAVQDHGNPQQEAQAKLYIKIVYYNATLVAGIGPNDLKYIIIAGAVGGVTVVLSIIIVIIILHIKRVDSRRRNGSSIAIQEQGDGRSYDKQLWHSVPGEENTGDETEKNIDKILKGKMGNTTSFSFDSGAELDDPYLKKLNSDQYGGQQFYTFRKHPVLPAMDDIQSNSSAELTASDSGRGGSEEDIQLPPLIGSEGEHSGQDSSSDVVVDLKERRHRGRQNAKILREDPAFQTFVPHIHPSFKHHPQAKTSFIKPRLEQNAYIPEKRQSRNLSVGSFDDPLKAKRNSIGKRVTFANEGLTQKNLQNLERILHKSSNNPPTNKLAFLCDSAGFAKSGSDVTFSNGGSWYPKIPRSQDDDDNTTTSGSYTLNPEDIDEIFCDSYPVS